MFFEMISKNRNTLSFQLTVWYAAIFTLSLIVTLSIVYYLVYSASMRELDENLEEELQEMVLMSRSGGIKKVKDYMILEVTTEDVDTVYRLFSSDRQLLAVERNHPWKNFDNQKFMPPVADTAPIFETFRLEGYSGNIRMITGPISESEVLQVGKSLSEIDHSLFVLRTLMFLVGIPLIGISALVGWRLARHALRDVEEVTRTAAEITSGSYEKRVPVKQRPDEIARLAETFNTMLDRLQTVMKSMGETNDNIAHDLRSPLTRIRGFAEMSLMNASGLQEYEKMAVSTIEECDNLIRLINTMLDITELESGAGELKKETLDVISVATTACELFEPIAQENGIQILQDFSSKSLIAQLDKQKLQRLIINLLENAIKYTLPGGTVTVRVEFDSGQVRIAFEDTGIGISEADLPRIFDRFYRCDRSRSQSGIGLGLSLAKAIACAMEGDISVSSTENTGSSFVVSLPA